MPPPSHGRRRIVLPPARRQAHTSCGRQGRRDASPRGSAEFSASRHSLEQRRGAAAEEFFKSRVSSIPYRNNSVVSSRRLKHLFLPRAVPRNVPRPATFWRAPRSGRGGVLASPQHPVKKNSVVSSRRPKHLFYTAAQPPEPEALISQRLPARARTCLLFHTITLESAAERARRASAPTHAAQTPAAPWHSSARPLKPLGVHKFSEGSRGAASESFCESNTLYKTPRPKHSRRNEVRAGGPNRSTARGNRSPKHAFRQSMLAISSLSHYFLITS